MYNENTKGVITHKHYFEQLEKAVLENEHNKEYLSKIKFDLDKTKPLEAMTYEEIYEHTVNLLVSVDISIHSNYCVLDNQSNVARFISIASLIFFGSDKSDSETTCTQPRFFGSS